MNNPATVKEMYEGRGDWLVHCPIDECSDPHLVHPTAVMVYTGHQTVTTSEEGTSVVYNENPLNSRGVITELHYLCETAGHEFSVSHTFHKGTTQVGVKRFKDAEVGEDGGIDPRTIWRN